MQSVIHSSYVGVDHIEEKTYFLLYEPYKAVKVIANLRYDNEWSISRMGEKKDPLIILVTGVMKQQPTVRAFLGRVLLFSLERGIKEGYFYVSLSMNQDFTNGPEFYEDERARDELEERGDEVEIPDSHDNDDSRAQNPYYTDDDEPYIPTENPAYVRRMSDSSLDSDLRQVNDQIEESMTDETLRFANNDLNQLNDPEERPNERNFQPTVSIDDAESSGSEETVTLSKQNTARKPRTLKNNQHLTNNHASGMRDTADSYNGK
ncbi:hypothetical protein BD560DRAFT_457064 [Blakeslea trispora]|nr:hypothetical protein BD560DRAFT_457064 [Blakeslea trispora]